MSNTELILVLGFPRSGTSALTRVLSLCGCALPQSVFGATSMNPTGHWEPVEATKLNIDFVTRHDLADNPVMWQEESRIDEHDRAEFIEKIQSYLSSCQQNQPLVLKEFRTNELMAFWLEAAQLNGVNVKAAIAVRHPQEVFDSSIAASGPPESLSETERRRALELSNTFWLKVNLLAERHSRCLPRVFVDYHNLMKDWRTETDRVSKLLALDLKPDVSAIESFLKPALHRQRFNGPVHETFGYAWVTRVYAILSAAARDQPIDFPSLDEIYHAYSTNARAFATSTREARKQGSVSLQNFVEQLPVWKSGREF